MSWCFIKGESWGWNVEGRKKISSIKIMMLLWNDCKYREDWLQSAMVGLEWWIESSIATALDGVVKRMERLDRTREKLSACLNWGRQQKVAWQSELRWLSTLSSRGIDRFCVNPPCPSHPRSSTDYLMEPKTTLLSAVSISQRVSFLPTLCYLLTTCYS